MNIVDRELATNWLLSVASCLGIFTSLFLLVDIFGLLDDLLKNRPSFALLMTYFAYRSLYAIFYLLPLATLIGGYWQIKKLRDSNEWTVYITSGINSLRLIRFPAIFLIALTIFTVFFSLWGMPTIASQIQFFRDYTFKAKSKDSKVIRTIHLKLMDGRTVRIEKFFPDRMQLKKVVISKRSGGIIQKRWDADTATFTQDEGWILKNVSVRSFSRKGRVNEKSIRNYILPLDPPSILEVVLRSDPRRSNKSPAEYSTAGLLTTIDFYQKREMNFQAPQAYLHWKISFPLTILVLGLTGFTLGIYTNLSRAFGIGFCMIFGFSYWIFFSVFTAIAQNTLLSIQFVPSLSIITMYFPPVFCLSIILFILYRKKV